MKNPFKELQAQQPSNVNASDFQAEVEETPESITINIRGAVGDEFESNDHASIADLLEASPEKDVIIKVNSPGGSVYDGFGIANSLISHQGKTTCIVEGLAFSAMSVIAIACDEVLVHKASNFGVHRSLTLTYGNQKDHLATIEWLDAIDETLISLYMDKTGKSHEEIVALIDGTSDGTILTAEQAVEQGFADAIYKPKKKTKEVESHRKQLQSTARKRAVQAMQSRHLALSKQLQ